MKELTYRDKRNGFEITFPKGWRRQSFLTRLIDYGTNAPEFHGPNRECLRFAIGFIRPEPSIEVQKNNLKQIARKYNHHVIEISSIQAAGKEHATMICDIPIASPSVLRPSFMRLKSYSLIFDHKEYLATADLGTLSEECYDEIIKSFKTF